jgi:N,N'-diacetyllegionaminate synthase|tara:strand:+ start:1022 stop:2029 length:1008 start_codon:yes stop_codon:yes gene_type:complete
MFNKKYPYVIAEVGSNHLGREILCKQSIIQAKEAGADCVKFQLFNEDNLVNKKLKIYKHVKDKKLKFQYQRFKKVKISIDQVKRFSKFSKKIGIDFVVTPFDHRYVNKIKNYVTFFKVASGDIDNHLILEEIAKTKKNVVISTGMSNLEEIKKAVSFFPKNKVSLLHCISSYPADFSNANLININYLQKKFNLRVGYSDHVPGVDVAANSVLFGAKIIEKHFMPKKTSLAGDYKLSIDKNDLKKMIIKIKHNFDMIGIVRTSHYKCENYFKKTLRRSIYFSKDLKKSHKITYDDLALLRPLDKNGLQPKNYKKIIGRRLKKNAKKHQLIKINSIK